MYLKGFTMKKKILAFLVTSVLAISLLAAGCGDSGSGSTGEIPADAKTVTISIDCKTVLDNMDKLDDAKAEFVPEDGVILAPTEVVIEEGDTVFDVLLEVCQENKIGFEHSTSPIYNTKYVEGIGQLYEFDCGELSGWNFIVDGEGASYGSDKIELSGGEVIEWRYTCDLGRDVGAYREGVEE